MNPPRATITLSGPATLGRLPQLLEAVGEVCAAAGADPTASHDLRLAVEEACVNVMHHAYRDGDVGDITLAVAQVSWQGVPAIRVDVEDQGIPFDPLRLVVPPLTDAGQARIGGLGVHLMRQVTDVQTYRHDAGTGNRLTLVRFLQPRQGEQD